MNKIIFIPRISVVTPTYDVTDVIKDFGAYDSGNEAIEVAESLIDIKSVLTRKYLSLWKRLRGHWLDICIEVRDGEGIDSKLLGIEHWYRDKGFDLIEYDPQYQEAFGRYEFSL